MICRQPGLIRNTSNRFMSMVTAILLITSVSCSSSKHKKHESPPGYDLFNPFMLKMPTVLDEISGLSYYPKDTAVFAINDEHGILFKIHLHATPLRVEQWKFSKSGDYEDLVQLDSTFYVLKSKGVLEKVQFISKDSVHVTPYKLPEEGEKNEFETLYYDSSVHKLIMICKNCENDNKTEITTWAFDPRSDSFSVAEKIKTDEIRKSLKDDGRIKPSAAAIHPITGELFVLASVNKALLVFNKDRSFNKVYALDPGVFKQPEGICFTPAGDLIISNEAAGAGTANILIYKYGKSKKP